MGEFHVVLLNVIETVIDGSGLDQAFEEAGKVTNNCIKIEIQNLHLTGNCLFITKKKLTQELLYMF